MLPLGKNLRPSLHENSRTDVDRLNKELKQQVVIVVLVINFRSHRQMWHLIHSNELLLLNFLRKGWKTLSESHDQKRWWQI